jgi:polygalacturonase
MGGVAGFLAFPVFAATSRAVNVRRFGARGDGRNDDTRALQDAIDAVRGGGIVDVPAGDYLIDALRNPLLKGGVLLHSGVHLRMAKGARLRAIANDAERSYILVLQDVSNVRISGGEIIGDRDRHTGRGGEWGHGIALRGASRTVIDGTRVSKCWGDGISIGSAKVGGRTNLSTDIEIVRVSCFGNRRQGLTIGRSRGVYVHDSEFSDTAGTPPAAGIDIEPDGPQTASDVRIERCVMRRNRGPGIQIWKLASDITIRDCTIEDNRNEGILVSGGTDVVIRDSRIRNNAKVGIAVRRGAERVAIAGNEFAGNAPGRPRASRDGRDPRWARHLEVGADSGGVQVAPNNRLD